MTRSPALPSAVAAVFNAYPAETREVLLKLRGVLFDVACRIPTAGAVRETLKWGHPSYAVATGTPLRLGVTKSSLPALFVHCQTTVVSDARCVFGDDLRFEGNRAVVIPPVVTFPEPALRQIILSAFTYRIRG